MSDTDGDGTYDKPWRLKTPPGTSEYLMYRDESATPPTLVCVVGKTTLGAADEQKPAAEGTVEAWGRSPKNPVGGWYGTRKGQRGRFGMYVPPLLERLGLAELEHNPRNNRIRAV